MAEVAEKKKSAKPKVAKAVSQPKKPEKKNGVSPHTITALKVLSDPIRFRILNFIRGGERNVTEICNELEYSQPAISHHLTLLRIGSIVEVRRDGKHNFYSLSPVGEIAIDGAVKIETALENRAS